MQRLFVFLVLASIYLAFDIYTYNGLSIVLGAQSFFCDLFCGSDHSALDSWSGQSHDKIFWAIYWLTTVVVFAGFIKVFYDLRRFTGGVRRRMTNYLLGIGFAIIVGKIVFSFLLFLQDIGRWLYSIGIWCYAHISSTDVPFEVISRHPALITICAILAAIPLVSMIYGVTIGKYRYVVDRLDFRSADLPPAFDGMKIVQISDIHAGTFDSVARVNAGIEMISDLHADLILFTGDLVNSHKDEIDPYLDIFAKLKAKYGQYSIMGNHDYYGLYSIPKEDLTRRRHYMADFAGKHEKMGFRLMMNESLQITKDGASITLSGVENWGAGPFPKLGDLDAALREVSADQFVILMSHDPTHWDEHVLPHPKKVHLTLAGHTHGMQFGINIFGFKWSPVKYRYRRWMGMYEEMQQALYVNRGFGFLGWPGRVGMRPEITLITLRSQR